MKRFYLTSKVLKKKGSKIYELGMTFEYNKIPCKLEVK